MHAKTPFLHTFKKCGNLTLFSAVGMLSARFISPEKALCVSPVCWLQQYAKSNRWRGGGSRTCPRTFFSVRNQSGLKRTPVGVAHLKRRAAKQRYGGKDSFYLGGHIGTNSYASSRTFWFFLMNLLLLVSTGGHIQCNEFMRRVAWIKSCHYEWKMNVLNDKFKNWNIFLFSLKPNKKTTEAEHFALTSIFQKPN